MDRVLVTAALASTGMRIVTDGDINLFMLVAQLLNKCIEDGITTLASMEVIAENAKKAKDDGALRMLARIKEAL